MFEGIIFNSEEEMEFLSVCIYGHNVPTVCSEVVEACKSGSTKFLHNVQLDTLTHINVILNSFSCTFAFCNDFSKTILLVKPGK